MSYRFQVKHGKRVTVASVTVALTEPPANDAHRIAELLARETAARGWRICSSYAIEVQANWISGGSDVTVHAFVTRARVARPAEECASEYR